MFEITQPINMAEFGLVIDQPSNSTALSAWSNSLDMRPKDNSVQGVYAFTDSFPINDTYNGASIDAKPVAVTQWTPAGSGFLNIAYVIESQKSGEEGKGRVFVYNTDTSVTVEITSSTADESFTIDHDFPPQLFVFDEVLIMNPGTGITQYISADATTSGSLTILPGLAALAGTSYPRVVRPYKNRLVAMNWYDDKGTIDASDDTYHPIDFVWSSNVTSIGSLTGATWQVTSTNTAGDAFLTSTPGKIVDGLQLGEDFIVYKTDSVVRVFNTDNSLVLGFETLLDDDGIYNIGCVENIGNTQHLVVGNYGVYTHDGRGDKLDIAKGTFQDALFALVKASESNRSFTFLQTRDKELWFCLSSNDNTGGGCDIAFVYDYHTKKIHKRSLPNVLDIYEAEINGQLRIFAASPDTKQIQELSTSTYVADGYFTITDKDFGAPLNTKDVSEIIINSEENVKIAFDGTYFIKDTKDYSDEYTYDASDDFKIDVRANGKYFSMKVTMDGSTNPKLTTMAFNVRIAGER